MADQLTAQVTGNWILVFGYSQLNPLGMLRCSLETFPRVVQRVTNYW